MTLPNSGTISASMINAEWTRGNTSRFALSADGAGLMASHLSLRSDIATSTESLPSTHSRQLDRAARFRIRTDTGTTSSQALASFALQSQQ